MKARVQSFPRRFGRYVLLDKVNTGGMAEVYRARASGTDDFERLVAIKCMLPTLAEDQVFSTMFIDEARMAAQLNHGNIVQIYELGRHEDQLYIAMELVEGHDLRAITRRAREMGKRLGVGFVAYIISKACEALDYAHNKLGLNGEALNLVHRDVSPQNILVSYHGEVKVVDFGIAKAEHRATETRAGTLKGKFAYMSPEQVASKSVDRRADIFSLAAVLFESATGRQLFGGDSDLAVLEKVRDAQLPDVEEALSHAPAQLAKVIRKACAFEPSERYQDALDMAEDLAPMLISRGNLFGPKNARTTMRVLYADEWKAAPDRMKTYAALAEPFPLQDPGAASGKTQIFGTQLAGAVGTDEQELASEASQEPHFERPKRSSGTESLPKEAEPDEGSDTIATTALFSADEVGATMAGVAIPVAADASMAAEESSLTGSETDFGRTEAIELSDVRAMAVHDFRSGEHERERDKDRERDGERLSTPDPTKTVSKRLVDELKTAPQSLRYALGLLLAACVVTLFALVFVLVTKGAPKSRSAVRELSEDERSVQAKEPQVEPRDESPAEPSER